MKVLLCKVFLLLFILPLFTTAQRKLSVEVDERIELLTTIQSLSNYQWITNADLTYKKEVNLAFDKFKNHSAVIFYKSISNKFYGYNPLLVLCHYQLPHFDPIGAFSEEDKVALNYNAYKDTLDKFIGLLRDFYKASEFHKFFIDHKPFYDSISSAIVAEAKSKDYAGILERHFGQENVAYKVILSPLQMDAGFGPMIQTKRGNVLYAIVGPNFNSGSFPVFDKDVIFQELVIHEFSHSFCNPLIDKFYKKLQIDSCLLKPILKYQKEQGYGDWKTCLYEHFTRANEIVLNGIIFNKEAEDLIYKKQVEEEKWIYLKGLVPLVSDYLRMKKENKSMQALMVKVIEYFDSEKKNCQ